MRIFIITDNKWWLQRIREIFIEKDHEVCVYCSPKGANLFAKEINSGLIKAIDVNKNAEFLIQNFELGLSCHCKQIFPKKLIEHVRCINIHPGLNPHNRGWFPHVFSIINHKPAGVTIHLMDCEIDHGDILYQSEVEIYEWDTSKTIYNRILEAEFDLLNKNIDCLIDKKYKQKPMPDDGNYNSLADYRNLLEINMDEKVTMREAINYLRALTHPPYQNCYFITARGEKVFVDIDFKKNIVNDKD